jgi:hydrogenase maturation protease
MTHVLGLGEPSAGDDGIGHAVVEALRGRLDAHATVSTARDASALIDALLGDQPVILVDALVDAAPPGTVRMLTEADLDGPGQVFSTHAMTVPQAVGVARALGATAHLQIVAIVVPPPVGLRDTLSPPVAAAVPRAADAVLVLLARSVPHA